MPHWLLDISTAINNFFYTNRTIVRLIKPLVLRRFRCRCGLCKISAVVVYKKSRSRLEKFQANNYRFPHWKRLYHLPVEISGNSPRNFWSNGKRPWTRKNIPESDVSRKIIGQQIGKVIYGVSTKTES